MFFELLPVVAENWVHILPHDLLRYLLFAGGAYLVVNVALRRRLAARKIRPAVPTFPQMRREVLASMRTVGIFALNGAVLVTLVEIGVIDMHESPLELGWGYLVFSIIALIVLHDAWFYWTHRLIHRRSLFRSVHRLHHRSKNPTPWAAYSFDVGEAFLNAIYLPLVELLMPVSLPAVIVFLTHMIFRNAIGHCGHELFPAGRDGRPLFGWLTTVTHHDLHHEHGGWNFGLYFAFWDRVMKTEQPLYHERFSRASGCPLDGSAVAAAGFGPTAHGVVAAAFALAALVAWSPPAVAEGAGDDRADSVAAAIGVGATQGHGAHIRIEPCDLNAAEAEGDLCGVLEWVWSGGHAAVRVGENVLWGLVWDGEKFADGKLRHPENGDVYRGDLRVGPDGILALRGCTFIFCASQTWRRVEELPGCLAASAAAGRNALRETDSQARPADLALPAY